MDNLDTLPQQIYDAYQSCSDAERIYLRQILSELSKYGESPTYNDIWLADYVEIPVSIDTFIEDPHYLGNATRNGTAVYPAWRQVLRDIFNNGNKYNEIVLTGATRIGKTSTGITGTAYMLYRLMCLRDPQEFFHKKDVSKFSILFFNVTKDLAKGVAFREFNDTLRTSPWFCDHGRFSDSEQNFYYIPDGGKIIIDYGSEGTHALGKQVFCIVGDTEVLTVNGVHKIQDLCDKTVDFLQYDPTCKKLIVSPGSVKLTKYVRETIRITLEDGSVLEGTPDHLVMLSDGSYKKLGELTNSDDLLTFNDCGGGSYEFNK